MKPVSNPERNRPAMSQAPVPNLHALLIGIDTYEHVPRLLGATNDVHNMEIFLRFDLSVPKSQIKVLKDKQATRSGIINALEQLREDSTIQLFDPILIYYAGHGCEINSPLTDPGSSGEKIQCLVPWDARKEVSGVNSIPPIPNYTIAALLDGLAAEKGNNITVLADCSFSAGITRGTYRNPYRSQIGEWGADFTTVPFVGHGLERSVSQDALPTLMSDTDVDILKGPKNVLSCGRWVNIMAVLCFYFIRLRTRASSGREARPNPPFSHFKQAVAGNLRRGRSHVLLSACGSSEKAYEHPKAKKGTFTSALLEILRSRSINDLTYKAIFEDLPSFLTSRSQNPICEGASATRRFLKVPVLGQRSTSVLIEGLGDNDFSMSVGDAQGVIPGSTYRIEGNTRSGHPLRLSHQNFVVQSSDEQPIPNPLRSQFNLSRTAEKPTHSYAKLVSRGKFHPFHIFLDGRLKKYNLGTLARALKDELERKDHGMLIVDSSHQANITLDLDPEEARYVLFKPFGFPGVLPHRCLPDANKISSILFTMAQWDWHLTRIPQDRFRPQAKLAELTLYRLSDSGPVELPAEDMSVSIPPSRENRYAVKIRSFCNRRLYAYLFYLSTASQSIRPLYSRIYANRPVDQALEPHGELMIGCENNDTISESLRFHNASDTGYFKLFLTTAPGDFDSMVQPSPFLPRMMYIPTMQLGVGGEYLDGVEIVKSNRLGHLRGIERCTSHIIENKCLPDSSTISSQKEQGQKGLNTKPLFQLGISEAEMVRMLQEERRDLWDAVSLKIVLASSPSPAVFKSTSKTSVKTQGRTMDPRVTPWFRSPIFTKESLSLPRFMKLRTLATLEPGPEGTAPKGQPDGYFEISVLAPDGFPKLSSTESEMDITFQSHSVSTGTTPQWSDGIIFGKDHEIWRSLEAGDCFEVSACVRGRGWTLEAQEGELIYW